jgi:hypothetical protein
LSIRGHFRSNNASSKEHGGNESNGGETHDRRDRVESRKAQPAVEIWRKK